MKGRRVARLCAFGAALVLALPGARAQPAPSGGEGLPRGLSLAPLHTPESDAAALGLTLPASFVGDLPCPDCSGIRVQLNLWPDRVFSLRRHRLDGSGLTQDAIGRWSIDATGRSLLLWDGEEQIGFLVDGPNRLRPLPAVGSARDLTHVLTGAPGVTPLNLRLPIRGMVSFLADRARITECLTGRDYPLASDRDFATLEAAYLAAGVAQGKPLMASFEGGITEQPKPKGGGAETVVVVDRFTGVWPEETCEQTVSNTSLTNTYWKIVRLGKTDIKSGAGGREPHLLLKEGETRFSATVGCNQLVGGFTRTGDKLSFGPAATTMMACPPPLDDWERLLGRTLSATMSWRVNGQALELLDSSGMQIALFQSVPLP